MEATKASSGSTPAGLDHGAGTTDGEEEAGRTCPPSKVHVCSREYFPFRTSAWDAAVELQSMVAWWVAMMVPSIARVAREARPVERRPGLAPPPLRSAIWRTMRTRSSVAGWWIVRGVARARAVVLLAAAFALPTVASPARAEPLPTAAELKAR